MASPNTPILPRVARSAEEAFALAQSFHENDRLTEAEDLYRMGLQLEPNHVGCRHYLGVIVGQRGRPDQAENLIRSALARDPNSADVHNSLGNVLAALKRTDEAIAEFRSAIALEPDHVEALNNLGITLLAERELHGAIACFEQALAIYPGIPEAHINLGNALAALNRHEEAIPRYHRALVLRPDFAVAHNNIGSALAALNRADQAIAAYERAIALNPDYAEAHDHLAQVLAVQNRHEEAIGHYQESLVIRPDSATTHNNFGAALVALDRHGEAIPHYERACALRPDFAEAHSNLGNALAVLERHDEALVHHYEAFAIQPGSPEVCVNLGNALAALDRHEAALVHYHKALAIRPGFPGAYISLGHALIALHRTADAIASFEKVLASEPNRGEAHNGLGLVLRSLGHLAESRQSFARAVELGPRRPDYYRNLSGAKRFAAGDPHLAAMEDLALHLASFSERQQIDLHFALGKALADVGLHDRAFHHLLAGNALKRRRLGYNETAIFAAFHRMKAVLTCDLIHRMRGQGDSSDVPIFIVGMPRSGTTLVEQVLASHPDVFGAGELNVIGRAVDALDQPGRGDAPFPELIPFLSAEQLRQHGARYLTEASAGAPHVARITDKMPGNFCYAGFIHLILPNARIIHVQRDPRDTCFSCYSQLFAKGLEWSYDLGEIGRYYRAYEVLMEHWRRVLPEGVMLEVQYEEIVADFESQARRIVAHCGLDWDERCLAFHETKRPIWTASVTQVREPIYRSSIGRWKPYEKMLQPLFDELSHIPPTMPEGDC